MEKSYYRKRANYEDEFKFTRQVVIVGLALYTYIVEDNSIVMITFKEKKDTLFQSARRNGLSTTSLDLLFTADKPIMISSNNIYTIHTNICQPNPIQSTRFHRAPPLLQPNEKEESLKPLNMNSINSYISFENCSGIISRIIFYDSK